MHALVVRNRLDADRSLFAATFLTHVTRIVPRDGRFGPSVESVQSLLELALRSHAGDDRGWRPLYHAVRVHLADASADRLDGASYEYLAAFLRENGDLA